MDDDDDDDGKLRKANCHETQKKPKPASRLSSWSFKVEAEAEWVPICYLTSYPRAGRAAVIHARVLQSNHHSI